MTDKDEFCRCIKQLEKSMYRLAISIVKNQTDAEEAVLESICRAYANLSSLKNDDAFKTWLFRIVHNTSVELIRKNAKVTGCSESDENIPDERAKDITTRLVLREAVESLKQPYRTVIILFYYEDLSVSEIAKVTETMSVTVRQQLSRGRKMLKTLLKEDFENEFI